MGLWHMHIIDLGVGVLIKLDGDLGEAIKFILNSRREFACCFLLSWHLHQSKWGAWMFELLLASMGAIRINKANKSKLWSCNAWTLIEKSIFLYIYCIHLIWKKVFHFFIFYWKDSHPRFNITWCRILHIINNSVTFLSKNLKELQL